MSKGDDTVLLVLLGGAALYFYSNQTQVEGAVEDVTNQATALIAGWKNAGEGPTWVPVLNQAEVQYGIPTDLLARQAFAESSFSDSVIRGTRASSAGALGILQMMPQYFDSVNVPRPYTDQDVQNQINQAAGQMASLYKSTNSWSLALAAYNAGLGNVQKYGGIPPFAETQNYVSSILADVPGLV